MKSTRLRNRARGSTCVVCGTDDGTTVLAHLPNSSCRMPAGMSEKVPDWLGAHLCFDCHEKMDGPWRNDWQIRHMALCKTLERLFNDGVLVVR